MVTTTPLSGQPSTLLRSSWIMAVNCSAVLVSLLGFKSSICFPTPKHQDDCVTTTRRRQQSWDRFARRCSARDRCSHPAPAECFNQQPQNTELQIQFDRRKAVASFV